MTTKLTRSARLLLGFLAKGEADAIFKQNPYEIPHPECNAIQLWRRSSDAVAKLPFTPPVGGIELLDHVAPQIVEEIKARPTYKKHYESIADYQFAMVPIASLLAPQWFADMTYIEELAGRISPGGTLENQIRFAMAEGTIAEPIIAGSQVIFTSQSLDLLAEQIPTFRRVSAGEFEVVVRASSRPNYVQVAAIGNRLLLTNGVRKVCAFAMNRLTHVPCVLRSINRIEESGLNLQTSLFRPDLLGSARPAQVVDFLNEDVAVSVGVRSMHQVLTVGIGIGMLQVPAVSPTTQTFGEFTHATKLVATEPAEAVEAAAGGNDTEAA